MGNEIKIRFVCQDLSGNIFFLYHTVDELINGFNLARNGRIEHIISKDLYTNHQDIKHKEIYEGDICQRRWHALPGFPDEEKECKIIETCTIVWDEDESAFMFGGTNLGVYLSGYHLEVIGTIHKTVGDKRPLGGI